MVFAGKSRELVDFFFLALEFAARTAEMKART
jgi:hypothetical protein